ncbi:MAG: NTP transferase domain-containing protein [Planctomycetia bacterium]|nr:NTP transferase domain-containing protein [Planctomycetia bacterium]
MEKKELNLCKMDREKIPAIILAAGKGTRMRSALPKVLTPLGDRPMIMYVLEALHKAGVSRRILIVGYQAERVQEALCAQTDLEYVFQNEQKGTGHAVSMCRQILQEYIAAGDGPVMIVAGDAPLIQAETLRIMLDNWMQEPAACLIGTIFVENPTGMGRILRNAEGDFIGIVEEKDALPQEKEIREVNQSYYLFRASDLLDALEKLRPDNAQNEYYLTDCPRILHKEGKTVRALPVLRPVEAVSVNTPEELVIAEELLKK